MAADVRLGRMITRLTESPPDASASLGTLSTTERIAPSNPGANPGKYEPPIQGASNNAMEGMEFVAKDVCVSKEYAYTLHVTEKSDIYSFGVVILELVTWKKTIAPEIGDTDLVTWVSAKIVQSGLESVVDQTLADEHKEEMCDVLRIALLCVSDRPSKRPQATDEVRGDDATGCQGREQAEADGGTHIRHLRPAHLNNNQTKEAYALLRTMCSKPNGMIPEAEKCIF